MLLQTISFSPHPPMLGNTVSEFLTQAFILLGNVLQSLAVLALILLLAYLIATEAWAAFNTHRQIQKDIKFFAQIEEYRHDFL